MYWCFHRCPIGRSLRSLLFSLVKFLWSIPFSDSKLPNLWYLDDGTFIGSRSCLHTLLSHFIKPEPSFGLCITLFKYKLYWPSGDSSFPNFPLPPAILIQWAAAWIFLDPIFEYHHSFSFHFCPHNTGQIGAPQGILGRVALAYSCLGVCKVSHLLRCVPSSS